MAKVVQDQISNKNTGICLHYVSNMGSFTVGGHSEDLNTQYVP